MGTLKFLRLESDDDQVPLPLPSYATPDSAGMDIHACLTRPLVLTPGCRDLIPTGFALEVPIGFEGQIRPRSGRALRQGLTVLNSPGTIDSDYRGELKVLLVNLGYDSVTIEHGDRIAQLVIAPVARVECVEVDALSDTQRGSGGFGHTGSSG